MFTIMNRYELFLIFNPALSDAKLSSAVGEVKELLGSAGGDIYEEETWGKRELAYEINNCREGIYVVLNLNLAADKVSVFSKELQAKEILLRFLLTKLES